MTPTVLSTVIGIASSLGTVVLGLNGHAGEDLRSLFGA